LSWLQTDTVEDAMEPLPQDARVRAAWEADRSYLLAIAIGMVGRPAEAEEVVQEAFARLVAASADEIDDVRGWLVVVTRRLCLNRLGSADARRTTPTAAVPETGQGGTDPADRLTFDDEVRRALAVVIDRLSPAERTSFILHDVFGFPFDAIAELVGRTPAAVASWLAGPANRSGPTRSTLGCLPQVLSRGR
jgi:RNA polymerase sigma-70 factor, ECF subfamily